MKETAMSSLQENQCVDLAIAFITRLTHHYSHSRLPTALLGFTVLDPLIWHARGTIT